jgi:hypothetical protein
MTTLMTELRPSRSRFWVVAAVLFTAINFGGGVIAVAQGEVLHAGIHVVLVFLGEYLMWRLAPARADSY